MFTQFKIWSLVTLTAFIFAVVNVISDPVENYIFDMVSMTIVLTSTLVVFLLSRWSKRLFVYLLPPLLCMTYIGMVVKIWMLEDPSKKNEWSTERHLALMLELVAIMVAQVDVEPARPTNSSARASSHRASAQSNHG